MSQLCRFYARGACRFGEKCRFLHPDYESEVNYQGGYQRKDQYYSGGRYGDDYHYGNEYQQYDRSSSNRYGENYRHQDGNQQYGHSSRYPYDENYYQDGYPRNDHYLSGGHYDDNQRSLTSNRGYSFDRNEHFHRDQRYDSSSRNNQYSEVNYGQNRFQWLSPDYERHGHSQETHIKTQRGQPVHNASKEKVPFSFKAALSDSKNSNNESTFRTRSKDMEKHSELVAEEAKAWELGNQWTFSCFFPFLDKPGCPEFIDVSPEEFRYQAYKAKENNLYDSYVNAVNTAMNEIHINRTHYKIQSPEKLDIIERIQNGEDILPTNSVNSILGISPSAELIDMAEPIGTSSSKPSAVPFRFVLPGGKTDKAPATKDNDTYTTLDALTSEEKEQYESSTFTVGKIPTRPPPYVLCF